jgi:NAD(P)-dependent dehydrogenase (short-subunit alcohol dehydrogenase family)
VSEFQGRVAVVTGAASGIGRALAGGLAARGARVAVSDVNEDGLVDTARTLEARGAEVHHARLDVADRDAFTEYAAAVHGHFGVVNQIYNNAGIAFSRPVLETDYEDYERIFAVNLWGVIHGTKAFLPHLVASGDGHVVNISSLNGIAAQSDMSHYCASKFAVRGFNECLRMELLEAKLPVRLTSVHPGGVKTAIASSALERARALGLPVTAKDEARSKTYDEKLLRMSPPRAAEIILKGVARNRGRVLVGNDARIMDAFVRLSPVGYQQFLLLLSRRI